MMQPCASAAKLRGGGSVLCGGLKSHGFDRCTTASDRHRPVRRARADERRNWLRLLLLNFDSHAVMTPGAGQRPVVLRRS
jgi:hypothetical protein